MYYFIGRLVSHIHTMPNTTKQNMIHAPLEADHSTRLYGKLEIIVSTYFKISKYMSIIDNDLWRIITKTTFIII